MRASLSFPAISLFLLAACAQDSDPLPTNLPPGLASSVYSDLGIPTAPAAQSSFEKYIASNTAAYASFQDRASSVLVSLEQAAGVATGMATSFATSIASAESSAVMSLSSLGSAAASEATAAASSASATAASGNAAPTVALRLSGVAVAGLVGAGALL